jgi:hypothetical protein
MNRTKRPTPKPVQQDSSEDDDFEDSDVDQFVGAKHRDDTLRPKTTVTRSEGYRGQPSQEKTAPVEATSKDVEPVEVKEPAFGSTSNILLLAMTRSAQPAPRQFKLENTFIPDCFNMFAAVLSMAKVLTDNQRLYEMIPDYTSIALYLYYSHVYFYQILRARDHINVITRLERRSLRIYETIGKPEAWPIATPMAGFIQALGACQVPDNMFSFIAPAFPDFTKFTSSKGLQGLNSIVGIGRVPIVPAFQQFLLNFSGNDAFYDTTTHTYHPQATPLSPTTAFVGLEASSATSNDFQTLAFSSAWSKAMETEEPIGLLARGGIMTRVARWGIPNIGDTHDFSAGMENFLFTDENNKSWMNRLLILSQGVNKFFPGSSNLGAIPPTTVTENFTLVKYSTTPERSRKRAANTWYHDREGWAINAYPKTYSNDIIPLIQAGIATSVRSEYTDQNIIPAALTNCFSHDSQGPYFVDTSASSRTEPLTQADVLNGLDPTTGLLELIFAVYNNDPK